MIKLKKCKSNAKFNSISALASSVTKVPHTRLATLNSPASIVNSQSALDLSSCQAKYDSSKVKSHKNLKTSIDNPYVNLPAQYSEFALYCFTRSQYQEAFNWSMEAVKMLNNDLSPKVIIDVLRTASKACVVRREFSKAEILIHEAVLLAREIYGEHHPKYADCLADFGFYLLNVDGVSKSYQAYDSALKVSYGIDHSFYPFSN